MSTLLLDEPPVLIQPSLVRRLGMVEAAIVQQLHYWSARAHNIHEGECYVYKTYQDWSDEIGISTKQARGALDRLRTSAVVIGIQNPADSRDRTLWWRIDYDVLNGNSDPGARSAPEGSSGLPSAADRPAPQGISNAGASQSRTKTTSEITSENARDARKPSNPIVKFKGKKAPDDVASASLAALAKWNEQTGQTLKPFDGQGKCSSSLSVIVGTMLAYPEAVTIWPQMIDTALRSPWWSDDAPGPGVVFGGKVRERMIQQAQRPAIAAMGPMGGPRLRVVNDQRVTADEWGAIAEELEARGM